MRTNDDNVALNAIAGALLARFGFLPLSVRYGIAERALAEAQNEAAPDRVGDDEPRTHVIADVLTWTRGAGDQVVEAAQEVMQTLREARDMDGLDALRCAVQDWAEVRAVRAGGGVTAGQDEPPMPERARRWASAVEQSWIDDEPRDALAAAWEAGYVSATFRRTRPPAPAVDTAAPDPLRDAGDELAAAAQELRALNTADRIERFERAAQRWEATR